MNIAGVIADLVSRSTRLSLSLILVLTVLAVTAIIDPFTGQLRIKIDPSANRLLSGDSPAKQFYDKTQRMFGSEENLVITLTDRDIFRQEVLDRIGRMTSRIEVIKEVHHVASLANVLDIRTVDGGLDISPFVPEPGDTTVDSEDIRKRVLANRVYAGNLVSAASDATALVVHFDTISDEEYINGGIHDAITKIVQEERGDSGIYMGGSPYFKVVMLDSLVKDLVWTPPIITVILALVLAVSFRTVLGVIVPLITVGIGVVFTLGTIAALDYSLSMISILVPPLLMILGLSYSVHVVSEYHQIRRLPDSHATAVKKTLQHMTLPVLLTGLTTIGGFIALIANPIMAIKEFGIFAAIGVVYITLLSITLTPALMKLLDRNPATWKSSCEPGGVPCFDRFVEWVARFDLRQRLSIFVGAGILFLLALAGMTQIQVSTEAITNFSEDTEIRTGFELTNEKLGGANAFYIVVEGTHQDVFKEPANLKVLKDLQTWLGNQPDIGGSLSIADFLMQVNQAFHENDPAFYSIPESRRLITQLLFLSSNDDLDSLVDSRYRTANIIVRSKVVNSEEVSGLIDRINQRLGSFPEHLKPTVTGNPVLISETLTDIISGQAMSVGIALIFVYGILSIMFMSSRIGLVALLPNLIPVAVYFGSLGFFGISLNPSTSLIAPMVLGIAIDDTIHYFSRFNSEVRRHANDIKATLLAMKSVGRPVTFTSVGLCLGFLVLMTSDLRMQVNVGLMASYALAIAWLCDFLLTPALCASVRFTTLWDALTLDLGENPQESIPLLKGLRASQARIVALMATVIEVPAGKRIIHDGETGEEMYVVIDGTLRTSVMSKDRQVELGTHERGDVIGEAGLFNEKRTADVDVVTDSRLLRLTQRNLDRLSRRYPYIATKVFRNLNKVMATRLSKTTHRLT